MTELWALPVEVAGKVLADLERETPRAGAAPFKAEAVLQAPLEGSGYTVAGAVAVVPVRGPLTRTAQYSSWTGKAVSQGQDEIAANLRAALADPAVRAILLDINSPGGVVAGTKELADLVAEARTKKRCAAYANGLCASAAYWLAAATGAVYAPETASVGSIGVIMSVADYSKLNEKWGVSYTYITGGKWKAVGNADAPLTEEERQYLQERISALHQIFKADVSRHMGLTADPHLWGEAQLLLARPARELGLVTDIVRDRDAAIRKLAVEAQMTREELAAQSPELVEALVAEGRLQAEAENKTRTDQAVNEAAGHAVDGVLAVVRAVAGDALCAKAEDILKVCRAAGMDAAQIAAVAPLLAKSAPAPEDAEAKSRADILAGIQAAHREPAAATPGTIPAPTSKSPLLADAERRAKAAN